MVKHEPSSKLSTAFAGMSVLRSKELERHGFSRAWIKASVSNNTLDRLGRGMYALPKSNSSEHQSLGLVTKSAPVARICLLSALRFHDLTTQSPHEVWIAIGSSDRKPALTYPKLRVHRFAPETLNAGIEEHVVDGIQIRVYSVAKTIVDLFRYRNKIGIDVALEALHEGWKKKRFTMADIDRFAKQCRMSRVMAPYIESLHV